MISDLLSPERANKAPKMSHVDVGFLALGLLVANLCFFFLFQTSINDAAEKGLEQSAFWLSWIYFPLLSVVSLLGSGLALLFMAQANWRNQGSILLLSLLSFGLMVTPMVAGSTQDTLMARSRVLSLLMEAREQGQVSSEESRLLKALAENDDAIINQASRYLRAKQTQELVGIAHGLGMDTQAMMNQGFATPEQIEAVMEQASLQAAPLHVLNRLSQFQMVEIGFKDASRE